MKKNKQKRVRRIAWMAFAILSIVFTVLACINPVTAIGGVAVAAGIMVGGVELTSEQEKVWNATLEEIKSIVDKKQKDYISATKATELINEAIDKFKELAPKEIKIKDIADLQTELDNLGKEITSLKESNLNIENKITIAKILVDKKAEIESAMESFKGKFSLKIPVASILKTTVTSSSITSDPGGIVIPGFGQIQTAKRRIAQLFAQFPVGTDSHGVIYYTDQTTRTSAAAARSAGSAAGESTIAWTGYSATLQSISDSIPLHKEVLSRISLMEAEIRNFLTTNLLLAEDNYLLNGTGTPPQIQGAYDIATTFDSAAYTGFKPKLAALIDLIVVMATQITKSTSYNVDYAIVNPEDMLGIALEKDSNGNRINFNYYNPTTGETQIKSIRVIESAHQTVNTLTIGDFSRARRYYGENITLEFGYNTSGDFTKRIITMLANMEELLLIRNCEADAFLRSTDIATDITNITAAGA